jgi:hypothetical protein
MGNWWTVVTEHGLPGAGGLGDCKQEQGVATERSSAYESFSHRVPVNAVAAAVVVIHHDQLNRLLARIPPSLDKLRTPIQPSG